jgi:hypothetical protein
MTTKSKIIWALAIGTVGGTAFWLWWRQKDAVPPAAVPVMAQAKAILAGTPAAAAAANLSTIQSIFAHDIPLPPNIQL